MTLEDHAGDIVGKARRSAGLDTAVAAAKAGISAGDYERFEETGRCSGPVNYRALGEWLALDGARLESVAKGWLPAAVDLSQWRHLRQITTQGASMSVHCYLVWDDATREAALFDTGFDPEPAMQLVEEHRLDLKHLFITHSHGDHIAGIAALRARYSMLLLHAGSKNAPAGQRLRAGETFALGGLNIGHRETPGHADDGVTYVIEGFPGNAPPVAMVGDAIFAGSMGGARQWAELAKQKVRDEILSLPGPALICPGHGPLTTVAEERAHNPYFNF